jgi:hypothetical protein
MQTYFVFAVHMYMQCRRERRRQRIDMNVELIPPIGHVGERDGQGSPHTPLTLWTGPVRGGEGSPRTHHMSRAARAHLGCADAFKVTDSRARNPLHRYL